MEHTTLVVACYSALAVDSVLVVGSVVVDTAVEVVGVVVDMVVDKVVDTEGLAAHIEALAVRSEELEEHSQLNLGVAAVAAYIGLNRDNLTFYFQEFISLLL